MSGNIKIGIDFGTTNSAVCYLDQNKDIQAIHFGAAQSARPYIPSCVAVQTSAQGETVSIGQAARLKLGHPQARVYTNFKMLLGEKEDARRRKWGYPDREPDAVATLYFSHLLDDVRKHLGATPRGVVVTIPEVWTREDPFGKREHLVAICEAAGIAKVKLHSEPEAAAVYFLRLYRKRYNQPFTGHILVCDCGGGTLDFCLAQVETGPDGRDQVTIRHRTGNGMVGESLGKAGVAYDEAVTEALFPSLRQQNPLQYYKALREFEEQKIGQAEEFTHWITLYREMPSAAQAPFVFVEDQGVTAGLLCEVFDRLVLPGLNQALQDMQTFMHANGIDPQQSEHFRVLPVGGFANYDPVIRAIRNFFKSRASADRRFETLLPPHDTALAIAKGAALIAAEEVDIIQLCPVTVGIFIVDPVQNFQEIPLPLLEKGQRLVEYRNPRFASGRYRSASGQDHPLALYFEINGKAYRKTLRLRMADILPKSYAQASEKEYLRCGFAVDDNQVFTLHLAHHLADDRVRDVRSTHLGQLLNTVGGLLQIP